MKLLFRVIARSVSDEAIPLLSKRLLRFARNDENPDLLRSYPSSRITLYDFISQGRKDFKIWFDHIATIGYRP